MVSTGPGRQGRPWRRAQALCMAIGEAHATPCCLCDQPIDYQFTRLYYLHRMAGTAHHIVPLDAGGDGNDQANLAPAHRGCNSSYGNGSRWCVQQVTSRQW